MVEFGTRLRKLRQSKNLTQKQLADLIGVKNSIISFYEVGDRLPSPMMIIKLSKVLHVSSDYLLGIEKNKIIDVTDLEDEDVELINMIIDSWRKKKNK